MPGIFGPELTRKSFVKLAAAAGTSAIWNTAGAQDPPDRVRVALLSDTHIPNNTKDSYRGFNPADNLAKVVPQVQASQPVAAIINGDAARLTGELADYQTLKRLLRPLARQTPIHIGLGNHDDRENFFQVFAADDQADQSVQGKHVSVFKLGPVRCVVLDSLMYVNKVAGLLGSAQRNWLKQFLERADQTPIVFFVHHSLGDGDGDLLDFDRVFELMSPYRQVKAIFYGHSHRYHVQQRGHIQLINQPAVGYNFNDEQPVGWLDASFSATGVELKLNAIGGSLTGDGATTRVQWS